MGSTQEGGIVDRIERDRLEGDRAGLDKIGGHILIAVHQQGLRIDAAAEVAAPSGKIIAGRGAGAHGHHGGAVENTAVRSGCNAAAGSGAEVEGKLADKAGADGLVAVNHQAVGIGVAGEVAAPAAKAMSGVGYRTEAHDGAPGISAARRIEYDPAGPQGIQRDAELQGVKGNKARRNGFVRIHQNTVDRCAAGEVTAPAGKDETGIGHRAEGDGAAGVVDAPGRIQRDTAAAAEIHRQHMGRHEGGSDGFMAVDDDTVRVRAAGEISAPAGKTVTGIGLGGEGHHRRAVVDAAGRVQYHSAKPNGIDIQAVAGHEQRLHGLVAIHQQIGHSVAAGQAAAPSGKGVARIRLGGEGDYCGAIINPPGRIDADPAIADRVDGESKAGQEIGGHGFRSAHQDAVGIGAAGQVAAPVGENVTGIRHCREGYPRSGSVETLRRFCLHTAPADGLGGEGIEGGRRTDLHSD